MSTTKYTDSNLELDLEVFPAHTRDVINGLAVLLQKVFDDERVDTMVRPYFQSFVNKLRNFGWTSSVSTNSVLLVIDFLYQCMSAPESINEVLRRMNIHFFKMHEQKIENLKRIVDDFLRANGGK